MNSPLRNGQRNKILEIEQRIVAYEKRKSKLVSFVTGLKEQFFNKEISFEEYTAILDEAFSEQSYEGALNHYNVLIEKSYEELRRIRNADSPKPKNNIILYSIIGLILILFSVGLFRYGTNPTGYTVFTTQQGTTDIINMEFNRTQSFTWSIKNQQPINSLLMSGTLFGKGILKMYILADDKKYLVYETNSSLDVKKITDICYESCMMPVLNKTAYDFVIELSGSRFLLQSFKYSYIKTYDLDVYPQRNIILFQPNFTYTFNIDILNKEKQDFSALVYTEGNISSYITLSDSLVHLAPDKDSQRITYEISLPEKHEPGAFTGSIVIRYIPKGKFTGETPVTKHTIELRVPYEGSFASANIELNQLSDSDIKFIIPIVNIGDTPFYAKAIIEIFKDLKKINALETNEVILSKDAQSELTGIWSNGSEGSYHLKATIFYANKTISLEKDFVVEEPNIQISNVDVSASSYGRDEIDFNVWVKNELHENLNGVYFDIFTYDKYQNQVRKHTSDIHDILQNYQGKLSASVNIKEYIPGDYNFKIVVQYNNESLERNIPVKITKDSLIIINEEEKTPHTTTYYLILLAIFLIIVNVSWLLYYLRKK